MYEWIADALGQPGRCDVHVEEKWSRRTIFRMAGIKAGSFEVYGLPASRWCPNIEGRIARAVSKLMSLVSRER